MRVAVLTVIIGFIVLMVLFGILAEPVHAVMFISGSAAVAAPSDCPGGTYGLYVDFDHSSGELWACVSSGASATNSSAQAGSWNVSATWGETNNGLQVDNNTDPSYTQWSDAGVDIIQETNGTVWMSVFIVDEGTESGRWLWEAGDGSTYFEGYALSNERLVMEWGGCQEASPNAKVTLDAWTRAAWSWSDGGDEMAVQDGDGTWRTFACATSFGGSLTGFALGQEARQGASAELPQFDHVYILPGYQTADPYSP